MNHDHSLTFAYWLDANQITTVGECILRGDACDRRQETEDKETVTTQGGKRGEEARRSEARPEIISCNFSSFKGLPITSFAPADRNRSTSSCMMFPVTPTMGPVYPVCLKRRVASIPVMTGMEESMKMIEILVESRDDSE